MSFLHLGKCALVSRPDICFVSMEFTLHEAVKLNTITGFSKAAHNVWIIKKPSGCTVCFCWNLLLVPGHKNLVNTDHEHRQDFRRFRPTGLVQDYFICRLFSFYLLCFSYIMLMSLGFFYHPKWVLKALRFSPVDQGPPCFVTSSGLLVFGAEVIFSQWLCHLCWS